MLLKIHGLRLESLRFLLHKHVHLIHLHLGDVHIHLRLLCKVEHLWLKALGRLRLCWRWIVEVHNVTKLVVAAGLRSRLELLKAHVV